MQKRLGDSNTNHGSSYGNYRDSRLQEGRAVQGISGSAQFYFADNVLLAGLETEAKAQGLQFIEELVFENGAIYKGKCHSLLHLSCWDPIVSLLRVACPSVARPTSFRCLSGRRTGD